mgnify:CR=1 FL=1|tara:strand:+ start:405 stop:758 length:354 start_codon:yes stop_codon:yes gene_type:complete
MKVSIELNNTNKGELTAQTVAIINVADNCKVSTVVNKVTKKLCAVCDLKVTGKFALIKTSAKINILIDGKNILTDDIKTLFNLHSKVYGLSFNRKKPENFKTDLINILEQFKVFMES